jgi:hypothetical protein
MNLATNLKGGPSYRPGAADVVKERRANRAKDDPNVRCLLRGAVRILTDDYYKRFFQSPDRLLILTERNMAYRQIFTDSRPFPPDPNPTWNGYSSRKWDGDTLVVQTIGFRDDLWLDCRKSVDGRRQVMSDAKVTEKFRRPNYGTLQVDITIDDPKTYMEPWTIQLNQPLVLDSELIENVCLENEKDA